MSKTIKTKPEQVMTVSISKEEMTSFFALVDSTKEYKRAMKTYEQELESLLLYIINQQSKAITEKRVKQVKEGVFFFLTEDGLNFINRPDTQNRWHFRTIQEAFRTMDLNLLHKAERKTCRAWWRYPADGLKALYYDKTGPLLVVINTK